MADARVSSSLLNDIKSIGGTLYSVKEDHWTYVAFPTVRDAISNWDVLEDLMKTHGVILCGVADKAIKCNPDARRIDV